MALAAGCGAHRQRLDQARPAEMRVEVLPRGARLRLDGKAVGEGSRSLPAPPEGEHVLSVVAEGYEGAERALPEGNLAGVLVAVALRPGGFGSGRALEYDDPEGLALAASFLVRSGAARDAADYARQAIVVDPAFGLAHRVLGDALLRLGDPGRAVGEWAEYLRLSPDAPDAAAVARRIEEARGDVTVK